MDGIKNLKQESNLQYFNDVFILQLNFRTIQNRKTSYIVLIVWFQKTITSYWTNKIKIKIKETILNHFEWI